MYLNKISRLKASQHFFNTEGEEGMYNPFPSQLVNGHIF